MQYFSTGFIPIILLIIIKTSLVFSQSCNNDAQPLADDPSIEACFGNNFNNLRILDRNDPDLATKLSPLLSGFCQNSCSIDVLTDAFNRYKERCSDEGGDYSVINGFQLLTLYEPLHDGLCYDNNCFLDTLSGLNQVDTTNAVDTDSKIAQSSSDEICNDCNKQVAKIFSQYEFENPTAFAYVSPSDMRNLKIVLQVKCGDGFLA